MGIQYIHLLTENVHKCSLDEARAHKQGRTTNGKQQEHATNLKEKSIYTQGYTSEMRKRYLCLKVIKTRKLKRWRAYSWGGGEGEMYPLVHGSGTWVRRNCSSCTLDKHGQEGDAFTIPPVACAIELAGFTRERSGKTCRWGVP